MATMVGDRQAAKNLPRRATFWFFATATSSLAGISINVVSNDAGYRWTAIGWVVLGVLFSAWWLRQSNGKLPAARWFVFTSAAGSFTAGVASLLAPQGWRSYLVIAAIVLGAAAVIAAPMKHTGMMLCGTVLVSGGIAFLGPVFTGGQSGLAAMTRIGFGAAGIVVGCLLLRGWLRAAGVALVVVGVLCLTIALVLLFSGHSAELVAWVFGSLGLGGILIGTVLTGRYDSFQEVTLASLRPVLASLALLYTSLGVVAVFDHRFFLAAADIVPALLLALAIALSFRKAVDLFTAMCLLGIPCVVDGVQTAVRGQTLSGTVSAASGLMLLTAAAYRYRMVAVAFWRYAFTMPAVPDDEDDETANSGPRPR